MFSAEQPRRYTSFWWGPCSFHGVGPLHPSEGHIDVGQFDSLRSRMASETVVHTHHDHAQQHSHLHSQHMQHHHSDARRNAHDDPGSPSRFMHEADQGHPNPLAERAATGTPFDPLHAAHASAIRAVGGNSIGFPIYEPKTDIEVESWAYASRGATAPAAPMGPGS